MTRAELRTFLQSGVTALNTLYPYLDVSFGYGRISEFNSKRNHTYPLVWWESIVSDSVELANLILPIDSYQVRLHIAQLDKMDSVPSRYEELIDYCHNLARDLMYQYNLALADSDDIVISDITRTPFVKKNADDLSGVILAFTLKANDREQQC